MVEQNARKINSLSMILPQKWFPLLRIMLQASISLLCAVKAKPDIGR
jgi:hypothetical protein